MSVVVIVLQTDPRMAANAAQLLTAFSDKYFVTRAFSPTDPQSDNMAYRQALSYAAAIAPALPCCVVLDTSVTNLSPALMAGYVRAGLAYTPDLLYLTHWLDKCGKYKTIVESVLGGSALKQTFEPTATQAICYSAAARDIVLGVLATSTTPLGPLLNSYLASGSMKGFTFVPNIVDMDVNLITSNTGFTKLNECVLIPANVDKPGNRTAALVTFVLIVVFTLVVAGALLRVAPAPSSPPA